MNSEWFLQIPCEFKAKNTPKFEYISDLYIADMRIYAPEKNNKFYIINTNYKEEAEKIIKNINDYQVERLNHNPSHGDYYKFKCYNPEITIIERNYIDKDEMSINFKFPDKDIIFSDDLGGRYIFFGDQYIGVNPIDFLNFPEFKVDFFYYTEKMGYKKINITKTIKFFRDEPYCSKKHFDTKYQNVYKIFCPFFKKENINFYNILKYKDKKYLSISIEVRFQDSQKESVSKNKYFIFELDEFLKSGRIVEHDLDDDFIKIRSQISQLSIDRHDSISF